MSEPSDADWASLALAIASCAADGQSEAVLHALLRTMREMTQAGMEPDVIHSHPVFTLMVAHLAELAGLQFHWPIAAEERCHRLKAHATTSLS